MQHKHAQVVAQRRDVRQNFLQAAFGHGCFLGGLGRNTPNDHRNTAESQHACQDKQTRQTGHRVEDWRQNQRQSEHQANAGPNQGHGLGSDQIARLICQQCRDHSRDGARSLQSSAHEQAKQTVSSGRPKATHGQNKEAKDNDFLSA